MEDTAKEIRDRFSSRVLNFIEHAPRRIYIEFEACDIPEVVKYAFNDLGCRLSTASALDTPGGIEILYHFSHDRSGKMITLKTLIKDKSDPHIQSITPFIKGAEWIEREMWEMLGIHFNNHPNLKRLLLAEDWPQDSHPLRHDEEKR